MNDEDEIIDDDEPEICGDCCGSGEGMHDGTRCGTCKGSGEVSSKEQDDDDRADWYYEKVQEERLWGELI